MSERQQAVTLPVSWIVAAVVQKMAKRYGPADQTVLVVDYQLSAPEKWELREIARRVERLGCPFREVWVVPLLTARQPRRGIRSHTRRSFRRGEIGPSLPRRSRRGAALPGIDCTSDADCSGGTCQSEVGGGPELCVIGRFRDCFLDNGTIGGSVTASGVADVPVNDESDPTLAAMFCIGPMSASAVNSAAGLPGLGRLELPGHARGLP